MWSRDMVLTITYLLAMGWVIARAHTVCHIVLREMKSEVIMTKEQWRLLVLSRNDDDECLGYRGGSVRPSIVVKNRMCERNRVEDTCLSESLH